MKEGEPKGLGKYYEFRVPEVTLGSFSVVGILKVIEGENGDIVSTDNLVSLFEGEDIKADILTGLGIVRKEMEMGKKVGIVFNPEEEIKYPEGWNF